MNDFDANTRFQYYIRATTPGDASRKVEQGLERGYMVTQMSIDKDENLHFVFTAKKLVYPKN